MSNVDKYRDTSRYRNDNNKSNLNLGSNESHHSNVSFNSPRTYSNDNLAYKTAQYSRDSELKYSHKHIKKNEKKRKRKNRVRAIVAVAILAVIGIAVWKVWPIKVTINNQELTLSYDKSLKEAILQSNIEVKPGNFIAVDYSLIQANEGYEYYAEVNDKEVSNLAYTLHNGDNILYTDGHDKMEDYDSKDSKIVAKSTIKGVGSIHKFEGSGEPGTWSKMTGKISKKYAERQTKDPDDVTCKQYNVDPGKDKVIALTFDDGPSEDYTQEILDILKKYDAKATFFVIGENIEDSWGKNLIKKEDAAGHQVCTHSYDHARETGGVDMTLMSSEKQIEEITKGKALIKKALGKEPSSVVRLPGGNMNEVTVRLIAPYVSAEIGWNIDTRDWDTPGKDKVLSNMKLASSGDIILCHDGGGDRQQTIDALKEFLKEYTQKGYKFITIDELMEYEEAEQKSDVATAKSNSYGYNYKSSSDD